MRMKGWVRQGDEYLGPNGTKLKRVKTGTYRDGGFKWVATRADGTMVPYGYMAEAVRGEAAHETR